jgi:hypothetical protein
MTARAPALVKTWSVGKRYRVTLTIPHLIDGNPATAVCEWEPTMPARLTHREQRDYERGRDAALSDLAREASCRTV